MHYQNLMADKEGTLKIIDFGMACLTIGGTTYTTKSSKSSEAACQSYDSLLMFASLLEGNDRKWITLQPRTINWIKGAFDMHPGNLYEAIKSTTTLAHVFHNMYFDNIIEKWTKEQQEWVAQSGRFTPEGFMKMTHKYLYALECVERDSSPCPKCGPVPLLPKKINVDACRRKRNTHRASAIRPTTKPRSATRRSPRTIRLVAATNSAPVNAATGSTGAITRARAAAAYKAHDTPAIAAAAEKQKKD
jgi:ribosomal protein L37AE/L43A